MQNIVQFSNGKGGGVQTIIDNIINLSKLKTVQYRVIYTIRIEDHDPSLVFTLSLRENDIIFKYSRFENTYYVFRRLSKLLNDENEIIIAHDWLELGMVSRLGLKNKVLFFLHADIDYYYNLAITHKNVIDYFICYSRIIEKKLMALDEIPFAQIKYFIYPVSNVSISKTFSLPLRIIYCVNYLDEPRKNFGFIIELIKKLAYKNIHWTIIGKNIIKFDFLNYIESQKIEYYPCLPNSQVIKIMKGQHLFLLPSYNEGLPVTLIEAMKCGVVPMVSEWNGAASDIIDNGQNGFILDSILSEYMSILDEILIKIDNLELLSENAKKSADSFCDSYDAVHKLESLYLLPYINKRRIPEFLYASRLDQKFIPNFLVKFIRKRIYSNE